MITVKQILEHYNIVTEKASNDAKNLAALVHAGLLEESKVNILNRALSKSVNMMTEAEKKSLQSIVESLASQVISEKQDYLSKFDKSRPQGYPSERDIPTVIILKRKAIRVYPDNQKVALYYSQALDRYISIPYGKNSKALDMTLNEEQLDEISQELATKVYIERKKKSEDEDLSPAERRKASARLSRLSKMMKRNIETSDGQKIRTWAGPTAVKRAKFISASPEEQKKMAMDLSATERFKIPGATTKAVIGALQHGGAEGFGAAAGALIGTGVRKVIRKIRGNVPDPEAKTIKPGKIKAELQKTPEVKPKATEKSSPTIPVSQRPGAIQAKNNRARPRPMIKESFRKHLEEKRQEKLDEAVFAPLAVPAIASGVSGALTAGRTALQLGSAALRTPAGQAVTGAITSGIKNIFSRKPPSKAQQRLANRQQRERNRQRRLERQNRKDRRSGEGLGTALANALGGRGGGGGGSGESDEASFRPITGREDFGFGGIKPQISGPGPATTSAGEVARWQSLNRAGGSASGPGKYYGTAMTNESNNLNILKHIVEQNIPSYTLYISETPIMINKRVAKKVVSVYESLNRQNKKKIEKMLNEDAVSFKKAINFAIKA